LTAGAIVAVLAIALIVGLQLNQRQQNAANPSASPTQSGAIVAPSPSASRAATVTPTPTTSLATTGASGGAVLRDDFGFIVDQPGSQGSASLRAESSDTRIAGISFTHLALAVSPDGKTVAYWRPGSGVAGGGAQLRIINTLGNSTEQTLVTLPADQRGGGVAWSSDGGALLYSTEAGNFGVGGGTNSTTLNIYELAANGRHGAIVDTQSNKGSIYRPIAWDRSANLAAAGITGEGGLLGSYVTVRTNSDGSFTLQRVDLQGGDISMGSVRASSDAKLVLGINGGAAVTFWPIADVGAMKTASGTGQSGAQWQPGSHEIGFISAGGGFVLFQADDGSASMPFSGLKSGSFVRAFRFDGTAVVVSFPNQGSTVPGGTDYTLYRLSDGASAAVTESGQLYASVRLR
jgi:hypothetical protein